MDRQGQQSAADAVTSMVASLNRQLENVNIQELSERVRTRTEAGEETALNSFGTAGTAGTLTGCFGTAGTFGSLGATEVAEASRGRR